MDDGGGRCPDDQACDEMYSCVRVPVGAMGAGTIRERPRCGGVAHQPATRASLWRGGEEPKCCPSIPVAAIINHQSLQSLEGRSGPPTVPVTVSHGLPNDVRAADAHGLIHRLAAAGEKQNTHPQPRRLLPPRLFLVQSKYLPLDIHVCAPLFCLISSSRTQLKQSKGRAGPPVPGQVPACLCCGTVRPTWLTGLRYFHLATAH